MDQFRAVTAAITITATVAAITVVKWSYHHHGWYQHRSSSKQQLRLVAKDKSGGNRCYGPGRSDRFRSGRARRLAQAETAKKEASNGCAVENRKDVELANVPANTQQGPFEQDRLPMVGLGPTSSHGHSENGLVHRTQEEHEGEPQTGYEDASDMSHISTLSQREQTPASELAPSSSTHGVPAARIEATAATWASPSPLSPSGLAERRQRANRSNASLSRHC